MTLYTTQRILQLIRGCLGELDASQNHAEWALSLLTVENANLAGDLI